MSEYGVRQRGEEAERHAVRAFELAEAVGPAAEVLIVPGESHGGAWRNGTAAYESAAASLLEAAARRAEPSRLAANEDSR